MKRVIKIGFPILCFVVIGGTFFLLNRAVDKVNNEKKMNEEVRKSREMAASNVVEEKVVEDQDEPFSISYDEINAQKKEEDARKEKAVEIVKSKDGTRTDVYYSNDGKNGEDYIVSIKDQESAKTIIKYSVNLETETIEVYGN